MTQNEQVLKHLKRHKSITTLQAFKDYGITRLASRIYDLREDGHDFTTDNIRVKTRYGHTNVTRYKLKGKNNG